MGLRVLIGIPCAVSGGYRPFEVALAALLHNRPDTEVFYAMGGVLPGARNRIVREAIKRDAEYVWFLDDDQPFHPGSPGRPSDLDALLAHELDAVIPLSPRRGAPFLPLLYSHIPEPWIAHQKFLTSADQGVIRVAAAGMAGLLIKTSVLQAMGSDGWFEFIHPPDDFDNYSEDLPFYYHLQKTGVQLHCDLEVRFGHATTSLVYIIRQGSQWITVLADKEPFCGFPQPVHPLALEQPQRKVS